MSGSSIALLSAAARFQRDLYLYLRAAREMEGLPLTTRGYVSRPALRRVRALLRAADGHALGEPDADLAEVDDSRLFFLRRLLERLGLLSRDEAAERATQRLVVTPSDQIASWFARPLVERLRICARVWVAGGWWPDASDTRAAVPGVMTPAAPRFALARRHLIESLAMMRLGETGTIPAATTHGRPARKSPGVRVRHTTPAPEVDTETTRAALTGPLVWLGFARLSAGKLDEYIAEAACGALASSADIELVEAHGRVTIQPDLSIVAYPPLTAPLLVALDLYADLQRLDRVARYKLSRVALARSGRGSWDVDALAERLERLTESPLPDNIRVTLRDWQRKGERLRVIEDAVVLELDDAALLDALLADRATRGWIERRLGAAVALIAPGHVADVRAWLLRHGELPATLYGLGHTSK
ncbi:MAG TPA: helicase-associated domain-containing protein [Ktedonobacterales bacterium]